VIAADPERAVKFRHEYLWGRVWPGAGCRRSAIPACPAVREVDQIIFSLLASFCVLVWTNEESKYILHREHSISCDYS